MAIERARVLLVDDDEIIRTTLSLVLKHNNFDVTLASSVTEALQKINSGNFDVLLSDLHMPGAGDGLTVVSAMRHSNPNAVTLLLSAYPEMLAAANAILLQADEILVKPMDVSELIDVIHKRLVSGPKRRRIIESVPTILERTTQSTIQHWFERVEQEESLTKIPLSYELRSRHLPLVFQDLINRLTSVKPLGTKEHKSHAAAQHGIDRCRQGYSAAMVVEESRLFQVSVFETLQNNLQNIDFSVLLLGVMTIADELDSQLSQAMDGYIQESGTTPLFD